MGVLKMRKFVLYLNNFVLNFITYLFIYLKIISFNV